MAALASPEVAEWGRKGGHLAHWEPGGHAIERQGAHSRAREPKPS
jgi:hypothetical protein